jgi:hypothetical protein
MAYRYSIGSAQSVCNLVSKQRAVAMAKYCDRQLDQFHELRRDRLRQREEVAARRFGAAPPSPGQFYRTQLNARRETLAPLTNHGSPAARVRKGHEPHRRIAWSSVCSAGTQRSDALVVIRTPSSAQRSPRYIARVAMPARSRRWRRCIAHAPSFRVHSSSTWPRCRLFARVFPTGNTWSVAHQLHLHYVASGRFVVDCY